MKPIYIILLVVFAAAAAGAAAFFMGRSNGMKKVLTLIPEAMKAPANPAAAAEINALVAAGETRKVVKVLQEIYPVSQS